MKLKNIFEVLGIVMPAIGFFLSIPTTYIPCKNWIRSSHLVHVIVGISLVIIGLGILIYSNKRIKK